METKEEIMNQKWPCRWNTASWPKTSLASMDALFNRIIYTGDYNFLMFNIPFL